MSNGSPDIDRSIFDQFFGGREYRIDDQRFGMGGLAVATDGEVHLVAEPGGTTVRKVVFDDHGPIGWSAKPFSSPDSPDATDPANFYPFSY